MNTNKRQKTIEELKLERENETIKRENTLDLNNNDYTQKLEEVFYNHIFDRKLFDQPSKFSSEDIALMKEKLIPFECTKRIIFVPNKEQLEEIHPIQTAYMWKHNDWTTIAGILNIVKENNKELKKYIIGDVEHIKCEIGTEHHHGGYHGFFKPSINEVFLKIPKKLIDIVDKIYINTDYVSYSNLHDIQYGITTVLVPCTEKVQKLLLTEKTMDVMDKLD